MQVNDVIRATVFGMKRVGTIVSVDGNSYTIAWDWCPPNYDSYTGVYSKEELELEDVVDQYNSH